MTQTPTFTPGSIVQIFVGKMKIATAQGINFSDNMQNQFIRSISSMGPVALEPLQYAAQASLSIQQYSDEVLAAFAPANKPNILNGRTPSKTQDGNSLNFLNYSSPAQMLLATSFDVKIMTPVAPGAIAEQVLFIMKDCFLTSWQSGINPGGLVSESINLLAMRLIDPEHEAEKGNGIAAGGV